jgi:hypothetical protein
MNPDDVKNLSVEEQLELQQQALAKIYKSVEQTRKYIMWSAIATAVMIIVPIILLLIVVPRLISTFNAGLGGLL